jgi:hypothetical protein
MIEFTPGGYDKNVEQIRKEARAALLAEVLAVIDEEYTESDEQRGLREAIDFHDVKCAVLSGLKYRLAALSPTPTRSVYEAMYCLIESAEGMSIQAELEHSFDLLRRALNEPNAEPGERCPDCGTPAGFGHRAGCGANGSVEVR